MSSCFSLVWACKMFLVRKIPVPDKHQKKMEMHGHIQNDENHSLETSLSNAMCLTTF